MNLPANINFDMLDRALEEDKGFESVMSALDIIKVYNPKPNEKPEPDKAGKLKIKFGGNSEYGGGEEKYFQGPLSFTPLSVTMSYSGRVYPRDASGKVSDEEIFFSTSEFHKFSKKTDVIGLSAKGQAVGFFEKGQFEQMIRTPQLNGVRNEFFKEKTDSQGKPYDGSRLDKKVTVYGIVTEGEFKNSFFRLFLNTSSLGITYDAETKTAIDAEEGTLEYCLAQGLKRMNELLQANGKKTVRSIDFSQIDCELSVVENSKGIFLPVFTFKGLVAERGVDNLEEVKYIRELKEEHHNSIYGNEKRNATPIVISNGQATAAISSVKIEEEPKQLASADVEEVFDAPDF